MAKVTCITLGRHLHVNPFYPPSELKRFTALRWVIAVTTARRLAKLCLNSESLRTAASTSHTNNPKASLLAHRPAICCSTISPTGTKRLSSLHHGANNSSAVTYRCTNADSNGVPPNLELPESLRLSPFALFPLTKLFRKIWMIGQSSMQTKSVGCWRIPLGLRSRAGHLGFDLFISDNIPVFVCRQ